MQTKYIRTTMLLALVVILVTSLAVVSAQDGEKVLRRWAGTSDVPTLDGTDGTDTTSIQMHREIFPGLTRGNEVTLELEEGMASWEVSEDGLTYTFSLLEGVPWVQVNDMGAVEEVMDMDGNPRYVTAEDFKFGMMRSMDPREGSYYGGILASWVAGGSEMYHSIDEAAEDADDATLADMVAATVDGVQITVVDEYTLEIVAPQAAAFAANIYGMWMSAAQPSWVIEEVGADLWYEGENIQTYGPYAVAEWLHDESLTLVKNPFWPGTDSIPVPKIDVIQNLIMEESAAFANYEADLLDTAPVPLPEMSRVQADATLSTELVIGPRPCSFYDGFNQNKKPFDDVRMRRAFSMAIDRQLIIDNILQDGRDPAYMFTNPALVAAPTIEQYPDVAIPEDAEAARALVDEYIAENGEVPPIQYVTTTSETSGLIATAFQQMWRENLGIEVEIQQQEWAVFLQTTRGDDPPSMWPLGWCQDYPDTHNFLFDVWHTSVRWYNIGWQNDEFDALLEEAMINPDTDARRDLYAQAEYILVNEDAVIMPKYFAATVGLTKPWVERTYGLDGQRFEKWDINN